MKKSKSLHTLTIERCYFNTNLQYNPKVGTITIGTTHRYLKERKNTKKGKSLHNIVINGCNFNTNLRYNTKTDHISIRTSYTYQKEKQKENRNKNREKINEKRKKNREKNREKINQARKISRELNRDPNTPRQGSKECSIKISCSKQGIDIEDFGGFITDQKYCYKFNEKCRESNRNKYDRKCFICGKSESDNGRKLAVHHIDMNKNQGCDSNWKLVPVCLNCHGKLHSKLWEYRIEYLINNRVK